MSFGTSLLELGSWISQGQIGVETQVQLMEVPTCSRSFRGFSIQNLKQISQSEKHFWKNGKNGKCHEKWRTAQGAHVRIIERFETTSTKRSKIRSLSGPTTLICAVRNSCLFLICACSNFKMAAPSFRHMNAWAYKRWISAFQGQCRSQINERCWARKVSESVPLTRWK